jgi:hypothetical protein
MGTKILRKDILESLGRIYVRALLYGFEFNWKNTIEFINIKVEDLDLLCSLVNKNTDHYALGKRACTIAIIADLLILRFFPKFNNELLHNSYQDDNFQAKDFNDITLAINSIMANTQLLDFKPAFIFEASLDDYAEFLLIPQIIKDNNFKLISSFRLVASHIVTYYSQMYRQAKFFNQIINLDKIEEVKKNVIDLFEKWHALPNNKIILNAKAKYVEKFSKKLADFDAEYNLSLKHLNNILANKSKITEIIATLDVLAISVDIDNFISGVNLFYNQASQVCELINNTHYADRLAYSYAMCLHNCSEINRLCNMMELEVDNKNINLSDRYLTVINMAQGVINDSYFTIYPPQLTMDVDDAYLKREALIQKRFHELHDIYVQAINTANFEKISQWFESQYFNEVEFSNVSSLNSSQSIDAASFDFDVVSVEKKICNILKIKNILPISELIDALVELINNKCDVLNDAVDKAQVALSARTCLNKNNNIQEYQRYLQIVNNYLFCNVDEILVKNSSFTEWVANIKIQMLDDYAKHKLLSVDYETKCMKLLSSINEVNHLVVGMKSITNSLSQQTYTQACIGLYNQFLMYLKQHLVIIQCYAVILEYNVLTDEVNQLHAELMNSNLRFFINQDFIEILRITPSIFAPYEIDVLKIYTGSKDVSHAACQIIDNKIDFITSSVSVNNLTKSCQTLKSLLYNLIESRQNIVNDIVEQGVNTVNLNNIIKCFNDKKVGTNDLLIEKFSDINKIIKVDGYDFNISTVQEQLCSALSVYKIKHHSILVGAAKYLVFHFNALLRFEISQMTDVLSTCVHIESKIDFKNHKKCLHAIDSYLNSEVLTVLNNLALTTWVISAKVELLELFSKQQQLATDYLANGQDLALLSNNIRKIILQSQHLMNSWSQEKYTQNSIELLTLFSKYLNYKLEAQRSSAMIISYNRLICDLNELINKVFDSGILLFKNNDFVNLLFLTQRSFEPQKVDPFKIYSVSNNLTEMLHKLPRNMDLLDNDFLINNAINPWGEVRKNIQQIIDNRREKLNSLIEKSINTANLQMLTNWFGELVLDKVVFVTSETLTLSNIISIGNYDFSIASAEKQICNDLNINDIFSSEVLIESAKCVSAKAINLLEKKKSDLQDMLSKRIGFDNKINVQLNSENLQIMENYLTSNAGKLIDDPIFDEWVVNARIKIIALFDKQQQLCLACNDNGEKLLLVIDEISDVIIEMQSVVKSWSQENYTNSCAQLVAHFSKYLKQQALIEQLSSMIAEYTSLLITTDNVCNEISNSKLRFFKDKQFVDLLGFINNSELFCEFNFAILEMYELNDNVADIINKISNDKMRKLAHQFKITRNICENKIVMKKISDFYEYKFIQIFLKSHIQPKRVDNIKELSFLENYLKMERFIYFKYSNDDLVNCQSVESIDYLERFKATAIVLKGFNEYNNEGCFSFMLKHPVLHYAVRYDWYKELDLAVAKINIGLLCGDDVDYSRLRMEELKQNIEDKISMCNASSTFLNKILYPLKESLTNVMHGEYSFNTEIKNRLVNVM